MSGTKHLLHLYIIITRTGNTLPSFIASRAWPL